MSLFSYQQGLSRGNAESLGAILDRNAAINTANEWQNYSNKLQGKLQSTEIDLVKAESGRIAFAHLFRMLSDELRRVDPNNPLLRKDTQVRILDGKVAEKVAEMGYEYDPQSGDISVSR